MKTLGQLLAEPYVLPGGGPGCSPDVADILRRLCKEVTEIRRRRDSWADRATTALDFAGDLQGDNASLRERCRRLESDKEGLYRNIASADEHAQRLARAFDTRGVEIRVLRRSEEALRAENDKLEARIAELEAAAAENAENGLGHSWNPTYCPTCNELWEECICHEDETEGEEAC